jgi:hypothetical protein
MFAPWSAASRRAIAAARHEAIDLQVKLAVGTITEIVNVASADVPVIETVRTQVAGTVVSLRLSYMPERRDGIAKCLYVPNKPQHLLCCI